MSGRSLECVLAGLPPVNLTELDARAALLTRRERKYLVPVRDAARLADLIGPECLVLTIEDRRSFRYESVYFDTPDGIAYLAAARRRPRRFKVRTRSYLDAGRCLVEVKTRNGRGQTRKQRMEYRVEQRDMLDPAARSFVARCVLGEQAGLSLGAVLATRYARSTLLLPEGARVTVDVDVQARAPDGRVVSLPDTAVIETKSSGPPSLADRALWGLGYRPIRVSKFCTSLAALDPALPSNRWTQALRRPWVVGVDPGIALAG